MPNITCTIAIIEVDGHISISANIPDGAENTIAGAMAKQLLNGAAVIMNRATGDNKKIEKLATN